MVDTQEFLARVREVVDRMAAERQAAERQAVRELARCWAAFVETHPSLVQADPIRFQDASDYVATLYLDCTEYDAADTAITITMIDGGDQS
ncbi:hypothetical protein ASE85_03330 [Sphingobium sp. Leaf26]|uniref:hypothetical protein n=1 Tax=Sphingobium sp. Leaf26 TaxID=1735693 RepID=UPI0006FEE61A|nr:hypothetical protein [Sphingobium sp. Leaf26]KQN09976.1 hypothetical protein ASE85_03330 [Sphingobium sp. Leaf26]